MGMEDIGSVAMLAAKRLAGLTPEVNLRKYVTHIFLTSLNKAAIYGFKTHRRSHQMPKAAVSVAPQKGQYITEFTFQLSW